LESQDRILLVSGTVDQLLTALHLVLARLRAEPAALRAVQARADSLERLALRMLVHTRLCGTLIGKGGATIRSFNEDSKAAFNISPPPSMPGLTERVVKITGDVDELMRAVALVVTKLSENPDYHLLTDANLSYSQRFYMPQPPAQVPGGHGYGGHRPAGAPPPGGGGAGGGGGAAGHSNGSGGGSVHATTVTLAIPEDRVGGVIGKGGSVINQIKDLVNVSIRISKKGDHLPGTTDRACQISGSPEAVELAQRLVMQKVELKP
jgi:RNA-binding protein Nova